jgi:hypothetical protein
MSRGVVPTAAMHRWFSSRDGRGALLDPGTAERLLAGRLPADDAPPRYRTVALAFAGLDGEATGTELRPMHDVVAAMSVALGMSAPVPQGGHRARRVVAPVLVAMLVTFGGLAAAGALPGPAQRVIADVLDTFGVHVPSADAGADTGAPLVGDTGSGPDSAGAPAGQAPATSPVTDRVTGASSTLGGSDARPVPVPPESGTVPGNGNASGLGNGAVNGTANAYGHDNATSDPGNSESGHGHKG